MQNFISLSADSYQQGIHFPSPSPISALATFPASFHISASRMSSRRIFSDREFRIAYPDSEYGPRPCTEIGDSAPISHCLQNERERKKVVRLSKIAVSPSLQPRNGRRRWSAIGEKLRSRTSETGKTLFPNVSISAVRSAPFAATRLSQSPYSMR